MMSAIVEGIVEAVVEILLDLMSPRWWVVLLLVVAFLVFSCWSGGKNANQDIHSI